ncbi:MAG: hypothetical protein FWC23_06195 [Chitinispirillia bacterium]|nr:hypothetical protein [Chitinispirillia bacterium]MCL2268758.1 hypothetical protein [Chitinispirillia bacterium]
MKKLFITGATVLAVIFCLVASCSGGFGTDSGDANELGPGIFGTDST